MAQPTTQIAFQRNPAVRGIEACSVTQSSHVFPNHAHDDVYTFFLMQSGASYCLGNAGRDSLVTPGGIGLINPGQVHTCVPHKSGPLSYRMLFADTWRMGETTGDFCEKEGTLPEFDRLIVADNRLWARLSRLFGLLQDNRGRLEIDTAFTGLVGHLVRRYGRLKQGSGAPANDHRAVRIAMEVLSENLGQKMPLETVAKEAGLSRYHFLRVFKTHTGLSPHIFRTLRRIDRAKHLLKKGERFSQVALETGFSDQSHFTNKFREYTGATPGQYLVA